MRFFLHISTCRFFSKILLCLFFVSSLHISCVAGKDAEWTILIYAQANNSLNHFAYKSFNDMASVGSGKDFNVLVQWYKFGEQGTFRYKIEKNKIALDQCISSPTDGNKAEDLISSMKWAVTKYPAKKYCLVLWNHGIGILDPVWGHAGVMMNPRFARNNPRAQLDGVTTMLPEQPETLLVDNRGKEYPYQADMFRGILFNERSRTYMNNQILSKALTEIKTNVLKNKKIDVLGMDACLMAMVEVGYQVKDFATYMVGSQEVELAYGWDYKSLMQVLGLRKLSPVQFAESIVSTYRELYKTQIQFYTQSAINLRNISLLKDSIDDVVRHMTACYEIDKKGFPTVLKKARNRCLRFSTPTYIDLHSFFQELSTQVYLLYQKDTGKRRALKLQKIVKFLQESLKIGQAVIQDTVIANTSGKYYSRAMGLSIYFPLKAINHSYIKTDFAKNSLWHGFLKKVSCW